MPPLPDIRWPLPPPPETRWPPLPETRWLLGTVPPLETRWSRGRSPLADVAETERYGAAPSQEGPREMMMGGSNGTGIERTSGACFRVT